MVPTLHVKRGYRTILIVEKSIHWEAKEEQSKVEHNEVEERA